MIQLRRVLACDGRDCGAVSLTVLQTTDEKEPNWQGWMPVRDDTDLGGEAVRHLCPDCLLSGNVVEAK